MKKVQATIALLIACMLLLGGCLKDDLDKFSDSLDDILARWDATEETAHDTPRFALATVILKLQDIRQEALTLDHPDCCQPLIDFLTLTMDKYIDTFQDFISMSYSDSTILIEYNTAGKLRAIFDSAYNDYQADPLKYCNELGGK